MRRNKLLSMKRPATRPPSPSAAAPVSRKAQKRAADRGFNARFAPPPGETLWDAHIAVSLPCGVDDTAASLSADELLACAHAECARGAAYDALRKELARLCGSRYPSLAFERWALGAVEEAHVHDH